MPALSMPRGGGAAALRRPLVASLFASSCLLSVVSWYTTQQGMALYLSPWFSLLASLGVQSALVLVAWLVGISEGRRGLLIAVYVVTAVVSVAFSYVSLHTWFASRERPAQIERRLYDELQAVAGRAQAQLTAAIAEGEKHVLALDEMTAAEKAHGFISRAEDADPWLARVREAVAREAASYASSYPEGAGAGLRYTAFDRHATLARRTLARLRESDAALATLRASLKPLDSSEEQLRAFRRVFDAIPWTEIRDTRHTELEVEAAPAYSDFVDRSASGQEDLVIAFTELLTAPTSRHVLAFTLAAFIDVIVFLLAYASGPFFFGAPEARWVAAGAALDGLDEQVFVRSLLRKATPGPQGLPRVDEGSLSPGERQLCLVLGTRGLAAATAVEDGRRAWLLDAAFHQRLVESLAERGLALQATKAEAAGIAGG
jgi:hypothetical protein